jgi:flagellar hook-basal body complex protein FliE
LDIWNIELLHFISWQWVQETTLPAKVNTAFGKRQTEVDQKWGAGNNATCQESKHCLRQAANGVQETTLSAKKVNTAFGKRQAEVWVLETTLPAKESKHCLRQAVDQKSIAV